ncbi:MAG TPA: 7-cyano-7-deazaguanine synthase QueC [Syntrophobacteraceae bacterium]|jgi:7-cyano-7-deazaguanine synthase|nr:7-cyano-7-deazaguanine synthase QueC [Syntrophobacteraceae bacterium]
MPKPRAVVLVSGGMDSCVAAAIAAREFEVAFLHLNYGQRTERRELRAFHEIAAHYGVTRCLAVSMEHLAAIGGSSLTDRSMDVTPADLHATGIPTSYVPFRNANLLAVAVSWAEALKAEAVFIGAVEEDSSGYPDCRRSFYEAYNTVIREGTKPDTHIRIVTPLIEMTKAEIVQQGVELMAPLHLTWSCYQREDVACGTCDSCALRLRGFQHVGVPDPIPYAVRPDYRF